MAVYKSDIVTTMDDLDTLLEDGLVTKDRFAAVYSATGALSDNDVILMGKIPVGAKIDSIILNCDDLGTTGDINVGFYPGDGSGTTISADTDAVDEDAIGTAIDVNAAAVSNTEIRFETKDINTANDKAWELAGLSARPDYANFYLAVTMSEASTAAGDIVLHVKLRDV